MIRHMAYKTLSLQKNSGEKDVIYEIYTHCLLSVPTIRRHLVV